MEETYIKFPVRLHFLLLESYGAETPSPWVEIALHDAAFDFGDNAVVAGGELDGGHLRDAESDGFAFGGHEDDFFVDFDASFCDGVNWRLGKSKDLQGED